MLKITKIELKRISNNDIYLFTEKGTRGGISYIAKRNRKAINKYMQSHDDSKPRKRITYFNANNLYDRATIQYLPYDGTEGLNHRKYVRS